MSQEFRSSKNYKEIISVMLDSQTVGGTFLWQTIGDKRITYDLKLIAVDPVKQKIEVEVLSDMKELEISEPCFIKIPIKESAFKSTVITQNNKNLVLDFPFEMVLAEYRDQKRIVFRESAGKTAQIRKPTSDDIVLGGVGMVLDTINVSKTGIGLYTSNSQAARLEVKDKIQVIALGGQKLPEPLEAEVVRKSQFERRGQLRAVEMGSQVGIRFSKPLPQDIFDSYTYSDAPVTFNDERLLKDQVFRETVKVGMKKTLNKILEKPMLKKMFQRLDVKREENQYLKNHIEILCEVLCQVGRTIGWVSENNLDKLVYVAYMHDIRYFDRPHLARIKDKRDLEFKKKKLAADDPQYFLEGPAYAAELAQEDINNHPDAPKILLQHRELPDGKGFPAGIKGIQFSPLTCLFIVCHEFVDYIIEEPDWTYADFLNRYRRVYTGTYFHKVFQVFEDLK